MMKAKVLIILSSLAVLLSSCGPGGDKKSSAADPNQAAEQDVTDKAVCSQPGLQPSSVIGSWRRDTQVGKVKVIDILDFKTEILTVTSTCFPADGVPVVVKADVRYASLPRKNMVRILDNVVDLKPIGKTTSTCRVLLEAADLPFQFNGRCLDLIFKKGSKTYIPVR